MLYIFISLTTLVVEFLILFLLHNTYSTLPTNKISIYLNPFHYKIGSSTPPTLRRPRRFQISPTALEYKRRAVGKVQCVYLHYIEQKV